MKVKKRDGTIVKFDGNKIVDAISGANQSVKGREKATITNKKEIARYVKSLNKELISVEEIQDIVEQKLMELGKFELAKQYIIYRENRNKIRNKNSALMKEISTKLNASDVQNQNANVDEMSFGGRAGEAKNSLLKQYALDYLMSDLSKNNHLNNEIYIHDLDSYALGMHNCYLRSTKFITSDGIRSFMNYKDGDVVNILAKDGKWRNATVHYYGKQPMYEITLERCGISKTVVATRNHRWYLKDGSVTDNLQIGDYIFPLTKMEVPEINTKRQAEMFALGFSIGDGTDHGDFIETSFCTKDKEMYIPTFEYAGYHIGIKNNYPYARKKVQISKQKFLDNKMWNILSFEDKQFLFYGYISADGSKTTNTKYIWTADERLCEMIEDISCLLGYHIFKKKVIKNNTNYKKDRILYQYIFTTNYSSNSAWKVTNICKGEHTHKNYEAWCLEEPVTHSFTLEGGIITGNCLTIPFDDLLMKGFNTRQTDVRPANSINTAFQLVAVIFQLQSLQQFRWS